MKVKMQIWDTAGSEEYRSINQLYYKKAAIVFLVFAVNDYESFKALNYWEEQLKEHAETDTIRFVVGTKIDDNECEDGDPVSKQAGLDYAKRNNAQFFLTSSKEDMGGRKLFQTAAEVCAVHQ